MLNTMNEKGMIMLYPNKFTSLALSGLLSAALLVGCSTTKTQADSSSASVEETSTVSASTSDNEDTYASMSSDERAEYFLYNEDLDETAEVEVTTSRPVAAIYFDFDVARLDRANMIGVERAYTWLQMHPDKGLAIIGHADKQGSHPYNQQLALNRAKAAGNALMQKGISSNRLIIISHGEDHSNYEDPKYNRRVIFKTDPTNAYGVNKSTEKDEGVIRVVTAAR